MRTNCANMQLHSSHLKVVPILAAKAAATEAASQTTQPTKVRSKQRCDIRIFPFFMQREALAGKNVLFCWQKKAGRQKQSWSQSQRSVSIDGWWLKPKFYFQKSGLWPELNL